MSPKMMLLAGAPATSAVNETSCTLRHFDGIFAKFLGLPPSQELSQDEVPRLPHAAWRSLPLIQQPLHTGLSQQYQQQYHQTSQLSQANVHIGSHSDFFTTADISTDDGGTRSFEDADALDEFCEHSLAVHNPLPSSQLSGSQQQHHSIITSGTGTSHTDTSFLTDSSRAGDVSTASAAALQPPPVPVPAHLSDLEDVPSAPRILALMPQTVTLNLIVGVISIAQPRDITTRWGHRLSLVEVLVGDDTKSGFAITFWLANDADSRPAAPPPTSLDTSVRRLQRQDVILVRNVGLHVFRGRVFGQSLRRGHTRVELVWRRDGCGHYTTRDLARRRGAQKSHPQTEKARQVKEWVLRFVAPHPAASRTSKKGPVKSWDVPPDDTQ